MRKTDKILVLALIAAIGVASFLYAPEHFASGFTEEEVPELEIIASAYGADKFAYDRDGLPVIATHVETPEQVKAIYMTSWVAGTPSIRKRVIKLLKETEANSVVIDIKDDTGRVSFDIPHPLLQELNSSDRRVKDMYELISELHEMGIYVIGRVAVFQDPHLVKQWPEKAVKRKDSPEEPWEDRKGLSWMDASSDKVWDYVATIGEQAHAYGFDEINYDYIRFPSDGNMSNVLYPYSEGVDKSVVIETFFSYLDSRLRPQGITISADLFGMTVTNTDDLNIGQVLEKAAPYFDYICPMVYPSHFPNGWHGFSNPAEVPYDVIKISMSKGVERMKAMGEDPLKLRPWLQDFNLGAIYDEKLVRDQIQATYDAGLNSWLMWDPKNVYTKGAFKSE